VFVPTRAEPFSFDAERPAVSPYLPHWDHPGHAHGRANCVTRGCFQHPTTDPNTDFHSAALRDSDSATRDNGDAVKGKSDLSHGGSSGTYRNRDTSASHGDLLASSPDPNIRASHSVAPATGGATGSSRVRDQRQHPYLWV
jgi:hypothetical protein